MLFVSNTKLAVLCHRTHTYGRIFLFASTRTCYLQYALVVCLIFDYSLDDGLASNCATCRHSVSFYPNAFSHHWVAELWDCT